MNSNKLATLLALNMPDPTDFPGQPASLRDLDSAVRCTICANFFDAPVSLSCGHSFCSMCIRDVLSRTTSKSQCCPICRHPTSEGQLRINPVTEEIVNAWKLARPFILRFAKEEEARASEPVRKKRKLSPSCVAGPSRTSSADAKSDISSDTLEGDVPKPDAQVDCPLCKQSIKYKHLNEHMDNNCASISPTKPTAPSSKSQRTQWSDLMGKSKGKEKEKDEDDGYRLPKVSYDQLKDKQLKDKLLEQGLSTTGDRPLWIARHQRWVMLHNANLDKSGPTRRSKAELLKDLKKWEEERKAKKKKTTVDDSYIKEHNSEFKKLVAEARRPKVVATAPEDLQEPTSSALPRSSDNDIIVVDSDDEAGP
ncbi:hypothetical protein C8J57DRAFT_265929 [Mycena rebaudengoi]|nr:hypothetical protein C8J57DRAFT_265929 [Mycena rebaudengoi]